VISKYDDKKLTSATEEFAIFNRILLDYRIGEILPLVLRGPVLDVGCGYGEISKEIASLGMIVHGIDPDEEKIKNTPTIDGCTFECTNLEKWHTDYRYNTIVCSHVYEHVEDEFRFLRACYELLNFGGRIIVTVPNALSLHKRLGDFMGLSKPYELSATDESANHKRTLDRDILRSVMRATGLDIIVEKGIMLKPFASAQMAKYLDSQWHDAFYEIGKNEDLIDYCSSLLMVGEKQ